MEFACHTWAFNHISLTEALGTIARLGFRYVDIGTGPHLDVARVAKDPRGVAAEIRRDLTLFNLQLSDVYIMLPRISLADETARRRDINLFKALLPFVVALEAPGATLSSGLVHPKEDTEAFDRSVNSLREMVEAAAQATPVTHLPISVEPHMDSMVQTPDAAEKLLDAVDDLALTLDWAQLVCGGAGQEAIAALLPRARHLQIRPAKPEALQTTLDDSRIAVDEVVTAIDESGYAGVVCVEYMRTFGWHGAAELNTTMEAVRMRDALREARDERRDEHETA